MKPKKKTGPSTFGTIAAWAVIVTLAIASVIGQALFIPTEPK